GGSLQIMYGIDGRRHLIEETLDHRDGYMGSRPVRIGNGAYNQLQLDIYGELLDAAYLYNKHGAPISYDLWTSLRAQTDWVCDNWRRKDERVGGTRRSTGVRLFETHVLGRGRSRHPPRRQAFVSCPTRPLAQSP